MSYMKGVRSGAEGNRSLLKQYHGSPGSGPAARQHYATGGAVKGGNPSLNEGLSAAGGAPAKPSLARPGRKMPGKGKSAKGGKTNVNVIIASPPAKEAGAMPPALGAGPPPMPPPGAGPGGSPMPPMRASGGRIANLGKYAHGGKVTTKGDEAGKIAKKETHGAEPYADGGRISEDSKRKAEELREAARKDSNSAVMNAGSAAVTALANRIPGGGRLVRGIGHTLTGGNAALAGQGILSSRAKRADADSIERGEAEPGKEDRKSGGRVARKEGGPVMGLSNKQGGAGGASGRLAKIKMYGK